MSTPAVARQPIGTPDGGRFAPSAQAEATDVSPPPPAGQLPAWDDLESRLPDALADWATDLEEGAHEVEFSELIGDDEDAMIEAYGEGRSDYLCSLTFHAQVEGRSVYADHYEPPDNGMVGRLRVMSGPQQLARSNFSHDDGPNIGGLLDHCVTGPDGTATVHTERQNEHGLVKEIRNPTTGELTDGPDGTAATRSYDRRDNIREEIHFRNGVKHGSSLTSGPDGSTVRTRFQHGVPTDGPNLEPAITTTHPDGSTTTEHRPQGVWAHTFETDKPGHRTSQAEANPATGGTIRTDFDGTGRTHRTLLDAAGAEQDGPNGEPAVEFRRPGGTVSCRIWSTNGSWTRTTDYYEDGSVAVEFDNTRS